MASKVDENRARDKAKRQGLRLKKSARRDRNALDYGQWYVIDPYRNVHLWTFSKVEDAEDWLDRRHDPE